MLHLRKSKYKSQFVTHSALGAPISNIFAIIQGRTEAVHATASNFGRKTLCFNSMPSPSCPLDQAMRPPTYTCLPPSLPSTFLNTGGWQGKGQGDWLRLSSNNDYRKLFLCRKLCINRSGFNVYSRHNDHQFCNFTGRRGGVNKKRKIEKLSMAQPQDFFIFNWNKLFALAFHFLFRFYFFSSLDVTPFPLLAPPPQTKSCKCHWMRHLVA